MGGLFAVLRPILVTIVIGGAATVMVAPALDMASTRLASRAASGNGAPVAHNTPTPDPDAGEDESDESDADEPAPTPKVDFDALLRACLDTGDPDSSDCARAQEHSGMSYEDFHAKIAAKLATPKPEPTKKPGPVVTKPKPAPQEDFWTVFNKCLDTRDVRSDVCRTAQSLIGFNDADFQAKFDRYLAERDGSVKTATPKPTATAKPTTSSAFESLLIQCGESRSRTSDACLRALVMSGIQPAEFWAKIEAKFGHFD